jgi:SAM-dependent methyltransferase
MMTGLAFHTAARVLKWPLTALVRPYPRLNQLVWDVQYALGLWAYLDRPGDGAAPLDLVERYAPRARILDLGCGTTVNLPLAPGRYRHYHGVDISRAAIRRARSLRRPDTSFEVADVLSYRPTGAYDVILLREVVYYFPVDRVAGLLHRLAGSLAPDGKLIVGIYDVAGAGGRTVAEQVRTCGLTVVEERSEPPAATIVLGPVEPAGTGAAR